MIFFCPGCQHIHRIPIGGEQQVWNWNGSYESPTFTPSIRIYLSTEDKVHCCHSFVTDGRINFLIDSTHRLAGKVVEIPDWDDTNK
jgi:hypothetical protein